MKEIIFFLLFALISGCSSQKKQAIPESESQFGKVYSLDEIKEELVEIDGDAGGLLMLPLKQHVYELGYNSTGTFLFNKNGQRVDFELCNADYPSPLMKNIRRLNHPSVISEETLEDLLNKLDDFNKGSLLAAEYDYVLFYVWKMDKNGKYASKNRKIHTALAEDVGVVNETGQSVKLVHLYVGNYEAYQIEQEDFKKQKIEYMEYLIKTGKVNL